jgi:hypothetical protein
MEQARIAARQQTSSHSAILPGRRWRKEAHLNKTSACPSSDFFRIFFDLGAILAGEESAATDLGIHATKPRKRTELVVLGQYVVLALGLDDEGFKEKPGSLHGIIARWTPWHPEIFLRCSMTTAIGDCTRDRRPEHSANLLVCVPLPPRSRLTARDKRKTLSRDKSTKLGLSLNHRFGALVYANRQSNTHNHSFFLKSHRLRESPPRG